MKPVAKKPCRECPFKKDSLPGWLGGGEYQLASVYLQLAHSDQNVACHMSAGFRTNDETKMRPCAGLAIYRKNVCKLPRYNDESLAAVQAVEKSEDVFQSSREFLQHHDTLSNQAFSEFKGFINLITKR